MVGWMRSALGLADLQSYQSRIESCVGMERIKQFDDDAHTPNNDTNRAVAVEAMQLLLGNKQ